MRNDSIEMTPEYYVNLFKEAGIPLDDVEDKLKVCHMPPGKPVILPEGDNYIMMVDESTGERFTEMWPEIERLLSKEVKIKK